VGVTQYYRRARAKCLRRENRVRTRRRRRKRIWVDPFPPQSFGTSFNVSGRNNREMDGGPLLTGGCDAAIDRGERNAKTVHLRRKRDEYRNIISVNHVL